MAPAQALRGGVPAAQASDPTATRLPFQFSFDLTKAGYTAWSNKRAHVAAPLPIVDFPVDTADTAARHDPVPDQEYALRLRLALPARVTVRPPVPVAPARPYGEYRSGYGVHGDTITVERTLRVSELVLSRAARPVLTALTGVIRQ